MRKFVKFFVFLAFLAVSTSKGYAATVYVNSTSGNDTTGDGTSGSPYKTFHKAYTAASATDTLNLTGTFDWSNADETGDSATSGYTISKNLTIVGQGIDSTIIQAASTEFTADRSVFTIGGGRQVTFQDLTVRYGKVASAERGGGFTVSSSSSTLTLNSVKVYKNEYESTSYYGGGGIFVDEDSDLVIDRSIIDSNVFDGKYYGAGGVYLLQSTDSTITNSTFSNNSAVGTDPTTFAYSYAEPTGGYGAFRFGSSVFTNCTFSGNTSNSYTGAIQGYYRSDMTITNCTIANNTSDQGVGGILYESPTNGYEIQIKNSIIANNNGGGTYDDFYEKSSSTKVIGNGYNIIESSNYTFSGTGTLTGNQANLNVSSTLALNASSYDPYTLALASGSVAINAGDPSNGANNGVAIPTTDQRGGSRNSTTDIGAYEYEASGLDSTGPVISSVASSPSDTSVTITWTTDENSSSQVEYGLTSSYGNTTTEQDTSTRVTSHSVDISSLNQCARYYYRVKSTDASSNSTNGSQNTFTTTGCDISTVSSGEESEIDKNSGGTMSLTNSNSEVDLTIPTNFYSENGTFQINVLSTSGVTAPTGRSLIDQNIYEFLAVDSSDTTISSFDTDVTVVFTYDDTDVSAYVEATLDAYKYSAGNWVAQNCTVDTSANTLTCTLSSFSVYGVFGAPTPTSSSSNSFSEDKRCHWDDPEETTWIKLEPMEKDGIIGMLLTWTQYSANKVDIYIDDSTGNFPWKIGNTTNDGHEFLANVASWQKIRIKPKNHCNKGDDSLAVSFDAYPNGWFGLNNSILGTSTNIKYDPVALPADYMVVVGDTLWDLAYRFYGDGTKYTEIMNKNDIGKDLEINQKLIIPTIN